MPSEPLWRAERVIEPDRALALISRANPALAGQPIRPLSEGWDNTVFVVGTDWVFRFPRREMALPGFARELAVLPVIAALLPLPIPVPLVTGQDDHADQPWPFAGCRLLAGRELADSSLAEADRTAAAGMLGRFLRQLHQPALRQAVSTPLPADPMRRAWPAARHDRTVELLDGLTAIGLADAWPDQPVRALLADARRLPAPTGPPVLVHGDLHIRHLLVDDAGRASGVIDWGDVGLADPAVDLSIGYAGFVGTPRAALLQAYGPVPAERELRARVLAIGLSAMLAEYAAANDRPALLAEALAAIARAVR